jgi:hypothetical protein
VPAATNVACSSLCAAEAACLGTPPASSTADTGRSFVCDRIVSCNRADFRTHALQVVAVLSCIMCSCGTCADMFLLGPFLTVLKLACTTRSWHALQETPTWVASGFCLLPS